jgi:hypothetical protein
LYKTFPSIKVHGVTSQKPVLLPTNLLKVILLHYYLMLWRHEPYHASANFSHHPAYNPRIFPEFINNKQGKTKRVFIYKMKNSYIHYFYAIITHKVFELLVTFYWSQLTADHSKTNKYSINKTYIFIRQKTVTCFDYDM